MKKITLLLLVAIIAVACTKVASPAPPAIDPSSHVVSSRTFTKAEICTMAGLTDPMFVAMLPNRNVRVDVYNYATIDVFGRPITASGIATYPIDINEKTANGIVLAQHFSYGTDAEVPSRSLAMYESLIALFGYVVVAPDYIGYGASAEIHHPYHHSELTGRASVEMLEAVRSNFAANNCKLPSEIKMIGYSQGAYSVMAAAKYMDDSKYTNLTIKEIYAGAGAYDLMATCDVLLKSDFTSIPATVPMMVLGLDYGDKLSLDISKVFKGPLLENYEEWILSKKYTITEISQKIGSTKLSDFIAPELYDPKNANTQKLFISLTKNSLIANWAPKGKVFLYHSNGDGVVPYENSTKAYAAYKAMQCDVTLTTIEGKEHFATAIDFYAACMTAFMRSPQRSAQQNAELSAALRNALQNAPIAH